MSEIYELPLSYRICKKYVVSTFKKFYGKYIVTGQENIPTSGPVIFAPNHVNALMDALAVLSVTPDHYSTTFLARADLFNKKKLVKPLGFVKIMPAFRIRDGYENLGRNADVFNKCVELLDTGNALCLMPEGNQEVEKFIRPLVKGIFRIAFQAQEKIGIEKPVKIVPIGIDIEHLVKFGKHIIINVGKPIDVSEYMPLYADNQAQAMNLIRDRLYNDLCELTLHLDSKEYYEDLETLSEVGSKPIPEPELTKAVEETLQQFKARQKAANKLVSIAKNDPERMAELSKLATDYRIMLKKCGLRNSNIVSNTKSSLSTILSVFGLLVSFPVFAIGFLLNFLPFFAPVLIRKKMKIKFEGFISSVQYVSAILTFPLFYLLQTVGFGLITGSSWWLIMLFIPFQWLSGVFAFAWYKFLKATIAQLSVIRLKRNKQFDGILKIYNDIHQLMAD